jgi:hypothetical protein
LVYDNAVITETYLLKIKSSDVIEAICSIYTTTVPETHVDKIYKKGTIIFIKTKPNYFKENSPLVFRNLKSTEFLSIEHLPINSDFNEEHVINEIEKDLSLSLVKIQKFSDEELMKNL